MRHTVNWQKREWDLVPDSLAPETVLVTITLNNLSFAFQAFRGWQHRADRQGNDYIQLCRNCCSVDPQTICFGNTEQEAPNSMKLGKIYPETERFGLILTDQWEDQMNKAGC